MADGGRVTSKVKLRRVEVVINPLSGSVGPTAEADMNALLEAFGLNANVVAAEHGELMNALQEAVRRKPDLLIVLAGDGTAPGGHQKPREGGNAQRHPCEIQQRIRVFHLV